MVHTPDQAQRFSSVRHLIELPSPEWLIEGVIPEQALILLYGEPGIGKTFLALDIAMSIANGTKWQGRDTQQGTVLYMSGEGIYRMKHRVQAWCQMHECDIDELPVHFDHSFMSLAKEGDVEDLCAEFVWPSRIGTPKLVVVDTLNRYMLGLDENEASQMSLFIHGLEQLRRLGASVLVIHHSPKGNPETYRGSGALGGAIDTIIRLKRKGKSKKDLSIAFDKQKDYDEENAITVSKRQVAISEGETSLIIDPSHSADKFRTDIQTLNTIFGSGDSYKVSQLLKLHGKELKEAKIGSRNTLTRVLNELVASGVLEMTEGNNRTQYYSLKRVGHTNDNQPMNN